MNTVTKVLNQLFEDIEHQPGSETTQIASTANTYEKIATYLKPLLPNDGTVLDYGAGLGLGSGIMQKVLGRSITIHAYEPSPRRVQPTFTQPSQIVDQYDAVICLNVLNVLEPELRDKVVKHLLSRVAPNGRAIIGTRTWSGDVAMTKSGEPAEEPRAIWLTRGGTRVYQKGFEKPELVEYIRKLSSGKFDVSPVSGIAKAAVVAVRKD